MAARTAAAVIALFSHAAIAQNSIDQSLVGQPTASPEVRRAIDEHVRRNTDDLFSDDPAALRRARNIIIEPLEYQGVSVAFRIAYGDSLSATLGRAVADDDPRVSLNALRIAGVLATQASTQHLLDGIAHKDEDTRFMATHAMELVFDEVARAAPAIGQDRARQLTDALGAAIADDDNPFVVDAAVRALDAAARGPWPAVARGAITITAQKLGDRVHALNPGPDDQWILLADARALERLRQRVIALGVPAPADARATVLDAATLAGHTLAYIGARLDDGEPIDDRERGQIADLATRAEALIFFSATALGGNPTPTNLAAHVAEGRNRQFIDALPGIIGVGGQLESRPFELDAAVFLRKPPGDP